MTQMGLDIETIEHLDFEFAEACENEAQPCDHTAEWFWILGCCGRLVLLCDQCHNILKGFRTDHPAMEIRCKTCGHILPCEKWLMQFGRI